ncbi:Crp/Fnr family transcriptional regulator [Candidatus Sulfidibacterium hydrothermale]|uniref:Crp/Fnr family transcriptional regulator n=1 Tax=Candidatus Sulfidibacterium hydrothermale TaxID=2875962 RepID=UPI001F0B6D5E|nr:Crp/Fnr family transcriptional regulator [Candidatus Sulfidibacterium hydrothermale]UBM61099.1 Crp/Fnr family transcriptional regulator [Candidatus Sulfidibacterium hydrothermale]
MFTEMAKLLKSAAPFTNQELEDAFRLFREETIRKNGFISKEGLICDRLAFIRSGLMRSFFNIKGKETTTYFLGPGSIAVAMSSFIEMKPAFENIQAIEDSQVYILSKEDLESLYRKSWKWQQTGRVIMEQYYVIMEKRSIALQTLSAKERYDELMKEHPGLLLKVPLHYVASYLGISPETLSRIRRG